MSLVSMGTLGDLFRASTDLVDNERAGIIAWLRAHEGQHERAIAAGVCSRGSTTHGELRDQAAYYGEVADALEKMDDRSWSFGISQNEWLAPTSERTGA